MNGTESLDRYFSSAVTRRSSSKKKGRSKHHSSANAHSRGTSPSSSSSVEPRTSSQLTHDMKNFQTELDDTQRRVNKLRDEVDPKHSGSKSSRSGSSKTRKTKKHSFVDDSLDVFLRDFPDDYLRNHQRY
ncbi:unnamed protein product [Chondrus crispus]|uniref:Uncharacterized protein n=1 Tax=Chondrus crispus TaxID=2769 RepID=R7Q7A1_CHOCR|nr:unnamed protein product [Chondrus crispus]CDF33261.1 unnamed protein product [Chondrus crispus]|eukprot:XP_005713064.1 unnamed protein product [Chondrus crispus]